MDKLFNQIKGRNNQSIIVPDNLKQNFTIEENRTQKDRLWRSATNPSVRFYIVLIVVNSIGLILFIKNIIG